MLAFALRNNPRAICLIKIISKWRGNASQKIDAIRKGLLRATHETENSIVISFFFPVGNSLRINSSFNVYSCNRELLDCYNTLIIVQVTVWILPPMCIKLKLVMVEGWTFSPTLKSVVAKQASEFLDFVQTRRFVFMENITRIMRRMAKGKDKMFKAALIANAE